MKIAMISPRYHPYLGGVETHVKAIAERLVQFGAEVDVFTTDPRHRSSSLERVNGVTVHRSPSWAPGDAYYVSPRQLIELVHCAPRFDIVHAHSYQALTCLNGALVSRRERPFVFTPHYHGRGETKVRNLVHLPWRVPGHWLFRRARRVICVSDAELTRLRQHFPYARAVVIPNGVRIEDLRRHVLSSGDGKEGRVVLYVGRLERYKNIDRLIASAPYLPSDCRVVIIGSGPYKEALLQQIRYAGVAGRVHIRSGVDNEELFHAYRTCDVCVNLSSSEAFGITLLEALAAGKPVVANDIPAFHEIGILSPLVNLVKLQGLNRAELAAAIVSSMDLSENPPDLTAYSWDVIAHKTLEVYHQVLREGST